MKAENKGTEIMKKCANVGDKIFSKVCAQLKKHTLKTEIELADFIKQQIKITGTQPLYSSCKESFPVIVTSGPRAGNDIHPIPTDAKLSGFVIIDFGIKIGGYCSDMTRTVYVVDPESKRRVIDPENRRVLDPENRRAGKPNKTEIDLYNTVLNAQNGSIRYFKSGFPVSASDAYVRGIFSQNSYKDKDLAQYFIHTLGHGISKKVHEKPSIFLKSKDVFKVGQMVTSEPGIYIPNTLGIRIEDMYLITDDKPIQITKSKKDLLVF